jgi:hypothetical protein
LDLERIVAELEQERDRLSQAIAVLKDRNSSATTRKIAPGSGKVSVAKRGGLTPAGRKRLSEVMRKRWAEQRKKAKSS